MKRVVCLTMVLVLCLCLGMPAFAAEGDFVPSIGYKGAPEIVPTKDKDGKDAIGEVLDEEGKVTDYIYGECLVITPVSEAKTSTLIPDDAEQLLLSVYDQLLAGTMQIPYEKHNADLKANEMVIRDLFDASWLCQEHPTIVAPKGATMRITFDLGVKEADKVFCMSYKNNEWNPIVSLVNNGDGTVTCVFEDFCPIEFSVQYKTPPVQTGDITGKYLPLWIGLLVASVAGLVTMLMVSRRKEVR